MPISKRSFLLLAFLNLILGVTAAHPQAVPSDVKVKLSVEGGKSVFKMGETTRLLLSFTAEGKGYYASIGVDVTDTYQDEIMVTPAEGVFDWKKAFMRGPGYTSDAISLAELSEKATNVGLSLNNFVRFDVPGKYFVKVKTKRAAARNANPRKGFGERFELITNEIPIVVSPMTKEEEAAEVKRLSTELDKAKDSSQKLPLAEDLANLAGDGAIAEKVRRYLLSGDTAREMSIGLTKTRNVQKIVPILEQRLRDREKPVDRMLLSDVAALRLFSESLQSRNYERDDSKLVAIRREYIRDMVESLSERKGDNLLSSAVTLFQMISASDEDADLNAKLRSLLLKNFDALDISAREQLLYVSYWSRIADRSLIPSIERMLNDKTVSATSRPYVNRAALERLLELDPQRARPYVVRELLDPDSMFDDEILGRLPDEILPEADGALADQIVRFASGKSGSDSVHLRAKALVTARFASAGIYSRLMDTYKTHSQKWQLETRGILLGYFAKYNDREAVELAEQEISQNEPGLLFSFFTGLARVNYPPAINELMMKHLAKSDPEAIGIASYLMAKYGPAENRKLIERRLNEWITEWKPKSEQFSIKDDDKSIGLAMVQVNLNLALMSAKNWKLTPDEIRSLVNMCMSEQCREHLRPWLSK